MEMKETVVALGALAQDTRLSIFRLLVRVGPEGIPVGRIGEELQVAPATLSFHLKELYHASLISSRQEGRFIYYSANFERMAALMTFLTQNCCQGMPQECITMVETPLGGCCPQEST
jgi:DNA-binding transcriptional ArsR family regulator